MEVRVRFAPSPTGYLHVGGLRTALYNYMFAKKEGGKCILRIEDTDRTRLVENAAERLISSMEWAGVHFDESPVKGGDHGPYVQSERLQIYKEHTQKLIEAGHAYYAFDSAEEIEQMRMKLQKAGLNPKYNRNEGKNSLTLGMDEAKKMIDSGGAYTVRLKVPDNKEIFLKDIIRGEVKVNSNDIDDQVLLKSDGFPTYHLANVVDDHLMKITHVIRGEEWLPSTPKHVLLYEAFGWSLPEFAHLPLLLNKDKTKLSKRQGDVAVEDYRDKGYLRDAFVNFIALLGWNPTADRELYSLDELISLFRLDKVNKGGAVFDTQKLDWMNGKYLREMPAEKLTPGLMDEMKKHGYGFIAEEYSVKVMELFRERINFLKEIPENAPYMFEKPKEYEEQYLQKRWKDDTEELISPLIQKFRDTDDFSHGNLHSITKEYCGEKEIGMGKVIHPLRLMITGCSVGAGMFETMEVLGKKECLERIDIFLEKTSKGEIKS